MVFVGVQKAGIEWDCIVIDVAVFVSCLLSGSVVQERAQPCHGEVSLGYIHNSPGLVAKCERRQYLVEMVRRFDSSFTAKELGSMISGVEHRCRLLAPCGTNARSFCPTAYRHRWRASLDSSIFYSFGQSNFVRTAEALIKVPRSLRAQRSCPVPKAFFRW